MTCIWQILQKTSSPQVEHQIAIQLINSLVVLMHFISEKHY